MKRMDLANQDRHCDTVDGGAAGTRSTQSTVSARGTAPKMAHGLPAAQGLYDPRNEHDACGVGFIANLKGVKSHQIAQDGLRMLVNLTHRGAVGADPLMGDGAGMLIQIPHKFFAKDCAKQGFTLPEAGDYAVAHIFMPRDETIRSRIEEIFERVLKAEGLPLIGWRAVPVDNSSLSKDPEIAITEPVHRQLFIGRPLALDANAFERKLFIARKVISNTTITELQARDDGFYIVSLSSRTIVYKGMFLADQLGAYYRDLHRSSVLNSALALVHQRFSTNTFPSWKLAPSLPDGRA